MPPDASPQQDFAFLDFEISPAKQELTRAGVVCALEPKVYQLLELLITHAERVVTKPELFRELWRGEAVSPGVLSQCVWAARQAVGDDGDRQGVIKTVRGSGYRFVAAVRSVQAAGLIAQAHDTRPRSPAVDWHGQLLGREVECRALADDLERAQSGRGVLRLVLGEAGIGKTHVAEHLALLARAHGATVLGARCFGGDGMPAYGPWVQAVRAFCEGKPRDALWDLMGPAAADLAEMLPHLRQQFPELPSVPHLGASQARLRLFGSFATFIKAAAAQAPLLILIEDIQDADEPSLSLLEYLASSISSSRVFVLATHRTQATESAQSSARIARLLRCPAATALTLQGLSPETTATLIHQQQDTALDPRLASAIHETTQGNPLFVIEIVRLILAVHGSLDDVDPGLPVPLPARIVHATSARLQHLGATCIELLEVASVVGRDFDARLLAAATERPYDAVLAALDEAVLASMLDERPERAGHFRFCHDLTRMAVYRSMPSAVRSGRHALIALTLERLFPGRNERLDELAYHFTHADPSDFAERALSYTLATAERCVALTAHEDAIVHYERALALCRSSEASPRRITEIELAMGVAQMHAKRVESGTATLESAMQAARGNGASLALARAALDLTPGFLELPTGTADWFNIRLLDAALDSLGTSHPKERARLLAASAVARGWSDSYEVRERLSGEALRIANEVGDRATLVHVQSARHTALLGPRDIEGRLATDREIIRAAESVGDRETSLVHRYLRICWLIDAGHPQTADREMEDFLRLATTLRQPQALWYAQRYSAMRALMVGRFEEAERLGNEFLRVGTTLEPQNALHSYGAQLAALHWQTGRGKQLLPVIEPYARAVDALPSWEATFAFLAADSGELSLARETFERVLHRGLHSIPENGHYLITCTLLADACAILQDATSAADLYERLLPYESYHVGIYALLYRGSVRRCLGGLSVVLGELDRAVAWFEGAVIEEHRVGAKPFEALSRYELARAVIARGAPGARERAAETLAPARALASELGMPELEARILELGSRR